ncbi:MAG TPA: addiction module protein [Planctomycetota bacterium]|nr:addiction module protein [Planctomycetota bacterium]
MDHPDIDLKALSIEQRLSLLEEIWDRLKPEDDPVTRSQRQELDRRLEDLDRDHNLGITWDEVLRQTRERVT